MNAMNTPLLRFEVEGLKASILHHLGLMGSELGGAISSEIDKAVKSYPWEERVKSLVSSALNERIDHYFRYGKGKTSIDAAIEAGFANVVKEEKEND